MVSALSWQRCSQARLTPVCRGLLASSSAAQKIMDRGAGRPGGKPGQPAQGKRAGAGTGRGGGHAAARLGAGPKLCAADTSPHARAPVMLTLRSTAATIAATANGSSMIALDRTSRWLVSRQAAEFDRRRGSRWDWPVARGGLRQLRDHRDRVASSSVRGIASSRARRAKSANIEARRASPACRMVSISSRTRCSRAGTLTVLLAGGRAGPGPGSGGGRRGGRGPASARRWPSRGARTRG